MAIVVEEAPRPRVVPVLLPLPALERSSRSGAVVLASTPYGLLVAVAALVQVAVTAATAFAPSSGLRLVLLVFAFLGAGGCATQQYLPVPGLRVLLTGAILGGSSLMIISGLFVVFLAHGQWTITLLIVALVTIALHLSVILRTSHFSASIRSAVAGLRLRSGLRSAWAAPVILATVALVTGIVSTSFDTGVDLTNHSVFGHLPPGWYAAVLLSFAALVANRYRPSRIGAFASASSVVLLVTGVSSVVFTLPRYSWTAKHVDITLGLIMTGTADRTANIYQAWPGFFAAMALVAHGAGTTNIWAVARWWPPAVDLATAFGVYSLARAFRFEYHTATAVAVLFTLANTIGQDYYSPQSVGFLLVVFALAWTCERAEVASSRTRVWLFLTLVGVALGLTHELSPYVLALAVLILGLFGLVRSRLAFIPLVLPAIVWALLNWHQVFLYIHPSQIGSTTNLATTGGNLQETEYVHIVSYAMLLGALILGGLAILAIIRSGSGLGILLLILAASPAILLVATPYGNEGDFRVYLFALPWLAIATALSPKRRRYHHFTDRKIVSWAPPWLVNAGLPVVLVCLGATYLVGDHGLDQMNEVRPTDLSALNVVYSHVRDGSTVLAVGSYLPLPSSGVDFSLYSLLDLDSFSTTLSSAASVRSLSERLSRSRSAYVVMTEQGAVAGEMQGYFRATQVANFAIALRASPDWTTVYRSHTATVFSDSGIFDAARARGHNSPSHLFRFRVIEASGALP